METVLISLVVFGIAVFAMAIGVIVSNKTIKGSCGGLNALFGGGACDICEMKDRCEKNQQHED